MSKKTKGKRVNLLLSPEAQSVLEEIRQDGRIKGTFVSQAIVEKRAREA